MCNTSRTDIAATNNIMDNTSTYSENETMATSRSHNATNNTQHTVNMTNSEHHGMRLLVPVQKANNNTAISGQPLANNYLQNDVVDIFTNNCRADSWLLQCLFGMCCTLYCSSPVIDEVKA
jgi:hypothetical protein